MVVIREGFIRTLVWQGPRRLIESVCAQCGASEVVSASDGSLQEWEHGHKCPKREPRPASLRSE